MKRKNKTVKQNPILKKYKSYIKTSRLSLVAIVGVPLLCYILAYITTTDQCGSLLFGGGCEINDYPPTFLGLISYSVWNISIFILLFSIFYPIIPILLLIISLFYYSKAKDLKNKYPNLKPGAKNKSYPDGIYTDKT